MAKYNWKAVDSKKELRTYQIKIDVNKIAEEKWLNNILQNNKLELKKGRKWIRKFSLSLFPDACVSSLANEVELNKSEFLSWASNPTLSFDGKNEVILEIKVPNIWVSADLMRGKGEIESLGGSIGSFVGDIFTPNHMIIKAKTIKELLSVLSRSKGKIWGIVVYAHGNKKGIISSTKNSDSIIDQKNLISVIKKYNYKLAKIYMMQCYSGYTGTLEFNLSDEKIRKFSQLSQEGKIAFIKNEYKKSYPYSYDKIVSIKIGYIKKKENKIITKVTTKVKLDWEKAWGRVGIYTHIYQGTNAALIDCGASIWNPTKWLGK